MLMSFPPATEMFQFAGFASHGYGFTMRYPLRGGLPSSEIPGSKLVRSSPRLFAAYHVLHRLLVPRHPPNALQRLIANPSVTHSGKTRRRNSEFRSQNSETDSGPPPHATHASAARTRIHAGPSGGGQATASPDRRSCTTLFTMSNNQAVGRRPSAFSLFPVADLSLPQARPAPRTHGPSTPGG